MNGIRPADGTASLRTHHGLSHHPGKCDKESCKKESQQYGTKHPFEAHADIPYEGVYMNLSFTPRERSKKRNTLTLIHIPSHFYS